MFDVVRRAVAIAGLTSLLLAAGGAAYADDPLPPDVTGPVVDCGLPVDDGQGIAVGEPAPGTDVVDPVPAELPPGEPKPEQPVSSDTGTATIEPPETVDPGLDPDLVCIASSAPIGAPVADTGGSGEAVVTESGPVPQLPRTGPAPLQPTLAVGAWLLLLGTLAALAGRRRTARV